MTLPALCPFIARCVLAASAAGEEAVAAKMLAYAIEDLVAQKLMHGVATLFTALEAERVTPAVGRALLDATAPYAAQLPMRATWKRTWMGYWLARGRLPLALLVELPSVPRLAMGRLGPCS